MLDADVGADERTGGEVDELDAEESEGASGCLRLTAVARGLGSAARRSLSPVLASEARANAVKVVAAAWEARG